MKSQNCLYAFFQHWLKSNSKINIWNYQSWIRWHESTNWKILKLKTKTFFFIIYIISCRLLNSSRRKMKQKINRIKLIWKFSSPIMHKNVVRMNKFLLFWDKHLWICIMLIDNHSYDKKKLGNFYSDIKLCMRKFSDY